jgi:hypothetical protein
MFRGGAVVESAEKEIQELKNRIGVLENKLTTVQHIGARFSMRYGEDDEGFDRLQSEIDELYRRIECLSGNGKRE